MNPELKIDLYRIAWLACTPLYLVLILGGIALAIIACPLWLIGLDYISDAIIEPVNMLDRFLHNLKQKGTL